MARLALPIAAAIVTAAAVAAPVAVAQTTTPAPVPAPVPAPAPATVPAGVTAGGIALAGQTQEQAQATLEQALAAHLQRKIVVRVAGRRHVLSPARAKLTFDSLTTAKRAVRAKAPGDVALALSVSDDAVRGWVARVAARRDRAARNATLTIGLRKMYLRRARVGAAVPQDALVKSVEKALTTPGSSRLVTVAMQRVRPAVNANDLRRTNSTIVTIDKAHFKLRLFKQLKLVKTYGVAVGQPAYPTPSGRYRIQDKQVNPVWSVPNSPWAGELQGTTVDGGSAQNPLKARWMGIVNGVGIHGTAEDGSIGSRASHGCIRMHVGDVIALYKRVPVGTPVLIR